jgi:hypothetical protein
MQEFHLNMINKRERNGFISYLFQVLEKCKCSLFSGKMKEK